MEDPPLIFPRVLKRRLQAASNSLRSLILVSSFVHSYGYREPEWDSFYDDLSETDEAPEDVCYRNDDPTGDPMGLAFPAFMSGITFPRLRKLDLREFKLYSNSLMDFLQPHRTTLRELRLTRNSFRVDPGEGLTSLALWGGDNLNLSSVEFNNYSDVDIMSRSELDRARFTIRPHFFQSTPMPDGGMVWPPEMLAEIRKELESMWLGGRRNLIEKEYDCTHTEPVDQTIHGWQHRPVYWA